MTRPDKNTFKYKDIALLDDSEMNNLLNSQFLNFVLPYSKISAYENAPLFVKMLIERVIPKPDLILLDVNMPELDGWEVVERLEESGVDVDIFMLSSSVHYGDAEKAKKYKTIKGYIEKPLTEDKIEEIIIEAGSLKSSEI